MPRRVLITNNTLAGRAGTELYVRDVAAELLARGHQVVAYSSVLGEVADEIRAATVSVVDRLDPVSIPPDVIHGHHHLETMTALLHYPEVPAVFFCHGWLPVEEMPPKFPRILRYVAVDRTCRDRLIDENGIAPERVRLLLNFVDLKRFKPRGPLPEKPARALVLSNQATESGNLPAIRGACARFGISPDAAGHAVGNPTACPEKLLRGYDLVFAKGRAALEALAVGAAVIVCDAVGAGPMVTPRNVEALRQLNFGIRALRNRIDVETISAEIARYNASEAEEVTRWVRSNARMDDAVDQLVALYEEVIEEHRQRPKPDTTEEMRAASAYLRQWLPNLSVQREARERLTREIDHLKAVISQLEAERNTARQALAETLGSSTLRLRDWLVDLPVIGARMKSLARVASARLFK
jgi:hypothetical protein